MGTTRPISRAQTVIQPSHERLGPLKELPGTWVGTGFNLIARPDFQNNKPFFLEINGTIESLEFTLIGGDIPNRGSEQDDLFLHGLHYLQQVADCTTHGALHIEPGLWIHIPKTKDPNVPNPTVVRQATIPHGDSLLAQSTLIAEVPGGPKIDPLDSLPFTDAVIPGLNTPPKNPLGPPYTDPYVNTPLPTCCVPAGLQAAATIQNPALVLLAAIQGQNITRTVVIAISTTAAQGSTGILNIPFVLRNANALQMDAIFWIEVVKPTDGEEFLQLQYVQQVILDLPAKPNGPIVHWPHISVATLVKQ